MKPGKTLLSATFTAIALAGALMAAPVAQAAGGGAASPAFANRGADQPSLAIGVTPSGEPEVASVGPAGTLWFSFEKAGRWHRKRIGGPGSAFSGPSLFAGPFGFSGIAVEGVAHTLQFFALAGGHWHHFIVAGPGSVYSAPSLAVGASKAGIAFEGPHHSLVFFSGSISSTSFRLHKKVINGGGTTFSAPSLVIRAADQATISDPANEADIAVQNGSHSLSYYHSLPGGHWQNTVIGGPGTAFSAPSLIIINSLFPDEGDPYLVVQGAHHSLVSFVNHGSWSEAELFGPGRVFSAPSLTIGDTVREAGMAFRGVSKSLSFLYFSTFSDSFVNDVITSVTGKVDSAPALFFRSSSPEGENDLVFQGPGNTLWYFHAHKPSAANMAPQFTGKKIAGHGTTFGG